MADTGIRRNIDLSGTRGLVIAAPSTGAGKTLVSLALARLLSRNGLQVRSFKTGPDYIDTAFLSAASGRPALNLDPWAMSQARINSLFESACRDGDNSMDWALVEGVMGLFDGAADGTGSTADLASLLDLPVLLVVNAAGAGASLAAVVKGFADFRPGLNLAGILFNNVASARHRNIIANAMAEMNIPVVGYVPKRADITVPSRHLGLVQAGDLEDLQQLLDRAADHLAEALDLAMLTDIAAKIPNHPSAEKINRQPLFPVQRLALADDAAFRFSYRHLLDDWHAAGTEIVPFSPLADQAPDSDADMVFLPGGYPELYAGRLASAEKFHSGMAAAASRSAIIYGECGGYMVMGEGLVDAEGIRHKMLDMLPVVTSFTNPQRHLGYRRLTLLKSCPVGTAGEQFLAHEFHYCGIIGARRGRCLFQVTSADNTDLGAVGHVSGNCVGSFMHLIDRQI